MHRFGIAVLLALAAVPAAAADARDAFDIVCAQHGVQRMRDAEGRATRPDVEWDREQRLSLDVTGNLWCAGDNCAAGKTGTFVQRDGDVLVLAQADAITIRYTRSTSRYELTTRPPASGPSFLIDVTGACRVEPYTGPAPAVG